MPAPSERTKPSRFLSNGRLARWGSLLRRDNAFMLLKPLMPIGDLAILEVVIRQLARHGVTEIVLAVGYLSSLIEAVIGDGRRLGARVSYSREEVPLGTAGPLSLIHGLDETFLLMNGDVLTTLDFGAMRIQLK